ncbi:cell surface protein [uncultured Bacteroides sp.]|uniref:cell surface protein n=1 Tax=uncultured Bacteroides sp. TaxID=162156 RepID=UPI0025B22667|nr:cell surface protein [uncultured Bacteroides sp.]
MNKKFLSAVLFGALMVTSTGTFVSCKDYDDDIKNLQEQIDSQKSDLTSKVTAVETSISSLQTAQSSLQAEIVNAKTEAQQAALAAQEAAIAAAKAELEDVKSEFQAAIAANTEDAATLKTKVAAIEASMTQTLGRIQTLEAFKTTTEDALKALGVADETLAASIATLNETVLEQGRKVAALEAQVKALEEYKGANEEAVKALKDKLADIEAGQLTEDMIEQIAEQVTEIAGAQFAVIEAAISKAVTHVEIVNHGFENTNSMIIKGSFSVMDLRTTLAEEDRVFGKGSADEREASLYAIANQKEFKKGERAFLTDSVLIRVSPSNAVLSPEQVSFVNTELGSLGNLVVVDEVKPFKGMATRGISANGLWVVKFSLNKTNYTEEAYMAAAKFGYNKDLTKVELNNLKDILYAVAVKDNPTEETDRYVTSAYGLTLASDYAPQYELKFKVNDTYHGNIRNRFMYAEDKTVNYDPTYVLGEDGLPLYDYAWNTKTVQGVAERVEKDGSFTHVDANKRGQITLPNGNKVDAYYSGYDNRNGEAFFTAAVNEPFTVELDYTPVQLSGIYGFYVVLDSYRAVESVPSELVAWNAYGKNIEGLNTITTDSKLTLNIKDASAEGDIIGFRVYAVNQNGALVDPDGKAFYVTVGEIKEVALSTTWTPTWNAVNNDYNKLSDVVELPADVIALLKTRGTSVSWSVDYENNPTQNNIGCQWIDKDGNTTFFDNAVAIRLSFSDAIYNYEDNGTYNGTLSIKNAKGQLVKNVVLSVTKEMPGFPEIFSAKAGQLKNGVHTTIDMYSRDNWSQSYDLTQVFNGLYDVDGESIWVGTENKYTFECEAIENAANLEGYKAFNGQGNYRLQLPTWNQDVAFELIGGTYDVTVSFTYEGISSENAENNHNYVVKAPADKNFKIKLNCLEDLSVAWNKFDAKKVAIKKNLIYGTNDNIALGDFFDVKKVDEVYNFANGMAQYEAIKDVKLVSASGLSEYFTVTYNDGFVFAPVVTAVRPAADVPSTLKFTLVDWFGHEQEVTLTNFVVKPE